MMSVFFRSIAAIAVVAVALAAGGQQAHTVSGDPVSGSDVRLYSNQHPVAAAEQQQIVALLDEAIATLPGQGMQDTPGRATGRDVAKGLGKVTRILEKAAARLDEISGSYEPPPEEDQDAVLDSLSEIIALANGMVSTASDLQRRTR